MSELSVAATCPACGRRLDPPDPAVDGCELCAPIGQVLGNCRLRGLLGRGGMGAVYLAEHLKLERLVAIKTISAIGRQNPTAVARFVREARVAATVRHPNLIQIYDVSDAGGACYMVMELIEGVDLAQLIDGRGALPARRAAGYAADAAEALAVAHAAGVVHRDIKPDNLVLTHAGAIKVIDFGLARRVEPDPGGGLTSAGQVMGTPHYMAPEQGSGEAVDGLTDVYSLGMTLYCLLAGRPPFVGDNPLAVLMQQLDATPPPLTELAPDVPPPLAELVGEMIDKAPAGRPTAAEVARRLRAWLAG